MADDSAHNYLGKELYVILSTPKGPPEEIAKILPEHLEQQVNLENKGILFAAGPMFEEGSDKPVRGMIIVRADSFDHAREIADADPFHRAGLREYKIDKWKINEGSYSVTISYSDQSVEIN